jgi:hypothetical protein
MSNKCYTPNLSCSLIECLFNKWIGSNNWTKDELFDESQNNIVNNVIYENLNQPENMVPSNNKITRNISFISNIHKSSSNLNLESRGFFQEPI